MKRFKLEDSNYPELKSVTMSCDHPLSRRRTIRDPFPNESGFFMILLGQPRSGKSVFMMSMFSKQKRKQDHIFHQIFKDILYVCPSTSSASMGDHPFANLEYQYNELSTDVADQIHDNRAKYLQEGKAHYQQCLVIDDCAAFLKKKDNIEMLNALSMNRRHLSLSIILTAQYASTIPRSVRTQASHLVAFKTSQDRGVIHTEFAGDLSKEDFRHLIRIAWTDNHDKLIIDRVNNKFFKNTQPIRISGDD